MTQLSQWPLPPDGIRFIVPNFMVDYLAAHPLTEGCYPVAMGYYPSAVGHRMQRPQHKDHLLIYCTAGNGIIQVDGQDHHIHSGDAVILPAGLPHQYHAAVDSPWSIYWVHMHGSLSDPLVQRLIAPEQTFAIMTIGGQAKLIADFDTLLEVRQTGYNRRNFVHASNLLRQLFTYLGALKPQAITRAGLHFDLDAVHALMQEKLHGQLDLETLARKVSLSKYHFSSKYKAITGQSPIQHFLHLKMEHACYMLDVSGNSIIEISRNLGYEDNYYFSRLFKKIIGVSPKQYRQLKRG